MTAPTAAPGVARTRARAGEDRPARHTWIGDRAALVAFGAFVAVAFPLIIFELGAYRWFDRDDWMFLTGREARSLDDLFRPHSDVHWSTVPILGFRGLWSLFGIRTYVPYQAVVVALHLSAAVLLRVAMRRAQVQPWLATAAAGSFVLFGAGSENIVWAFQIGFTGSLTFGLAHLLLADHDGPVDRRDWIGLGAGLLALMSSSVGIPMVIAVGVATLVRRGWRVAALHTAPLAAAYGTYAAVEDLDTDGLFGRPTLEAVARWVKSGEIGVFRSLGQYEIVAATLAIVGVAGAALVAVTLRGRALRERIAIPAALVIGGLAFAVITAYGRWWMGDEAARASRYMHLGAAFTLPALAVAADSVARRRRVLLAPMLALFLIGIPGNVDEFGNSAFGEAYHRHNEAVLTSVVRMPEAREVPRDVQPLSDPYMGDRVTIGFLLDAQRAGKLDASSVPIGPRFRSELVVRLGVALRTADAPPVDCAEMTEPLDVSPERGTVYGITAPVQISLRGTGGPVAPVVFSTAGGNELTVELDGLDLRFEPVRGARSFSICRDVRPRAG